MESARRTRTQQTKQRILDAAFGVFAEAGYTATTMRAIAGRAGVATQTLYFFFNTKPDLFRAVLAYASSGDVEGAPVPQRAWYREAMSSRDPSQVLSLLVENGSGILDRLGPLSHVIAEAGTLEPEIAQRQRELAASRRTGLRRVIKHLADLRALRADLTVTQASDVVFVLLGPDTYRRFAGCGWTAQQWKQWILRSLRELLLATR